MKSQIHHMNDNTSKTEEERLDAKYIFIGKQVAEYHERHRQHIEEMTPSWKDAGQKMRNIREQLNISRRQLSQYVGVCPQVIAKLENGQPIRSRNAINQSCITSMKFINLQRSTALQNFES